MVERRQFVRYSAFMDVLYKPASTHAPIFRCRSRDVSQGGLRLYGDQDIGMGQMLELELKIPGDSSPVSAVGKVVWSKKTRAYCYEAGIQFEGITMYDRNRLVSYGMTAA